jgi:hypothetical protein
MYIILGHKYERARKLNKKLSIMTIALITGLFTGGGSYIFTAPYAGNSGLSRMPGVRIGGTLTAAPEDFSSFNDIGTNLIMKLDGFPPFVVYLAYVGTPEGVITGTRPDGGYWPQRVREGRNEGWLRIGDETFAMQATEIHGDDRLPMLELWRPRAVRSARAIAQASGETVSTRDSSTEPSEPQLLPEIFLWTPR